MDRPGAEIEDSKKMAHMNWSPDMRLDTYTEMVHSVGIRHAKTS